MLAVPAPSAGTCCWCLSARYSRSRCCVPELVPSVTQRLFLKLAQFNFWAGTAPTSCGTSMWPNRPWCSGSVSAWESLGVLCLSHSSLIPSQCILQRVLAVVYSVTKIFCLPIQFQNRNRKPNRGYRWEQQLNRAGWALSGWQFLSKMLYIS